MKMMTMEEIRTELGLTDSMIHSLLQDPTRTPSGAAKPHADTHADYTSRERVLAVAQSREGQVAKRRWA
jgi:hypothetical protein